MRTAEQNEVLGTFLTLLEGPTGDGGAKRGRGEKPSWKVDTSHLAAAYRHLDPSRERYDEDSGTHKFVHAAWRLLAVAHQEMREDGLLPEEPRPQVSYASRAKIAKVYGRPDTDAGPEMMDVAPAEPTALAGPGRFMVEDGEAHLVVPAE
jgi:hypothetical protein